MHRAIGAIAAAALLCGGAAACTPYAAGGVAATNASLHQAQAATRAHNATAALAALDRAENTWLEADAARGNPIVHHERPELRAIGHARSAVQLARWDDAAHYIRSALSGVAAPNQG